MILVDTSVVTNRLCQRALEPNDARNRPAWRVPTLRPNVAVARSGRGTTARALGAMMATQRKVYPQDG